MRYSNLHNHTIFSDGKHTVEENILSAIDKNMLSLGFSDHSFTERDPSYCMHPEQYDTYLATIRELGSKYADRLPVYAGMELDYYSAVDTTPFDYIIASIHYLEINGEFYPIDHSAAQQLQCRDEAFGGDILKMAQHYFDLLVEHVERVKPTFVGHFDVITKFSLMPEEDPRYQQIARDALKEVLKHCKYLEMNTGAIARGWRKVPYPAPYLLETLLENGGQILLGSDSHNKDNLIFHFDEAVHLLKEAGFAHIAVFNGKDFDLQQI